MKAVQVVVFISTLCFLTAIQDTEDCSGNFLNVPYCTYFKGDPQSNIVIFSPHGGFLKPPSIKSRRDGCYINNECQYNHVCAPQNSQECDVSTSADGYTMEIAFSLRDKLQNLTGATPHFVVSYLHRSKLDPNREINEATQGEIEAITAYNQMHSFVATARDNIIGNGLFIDVHGHTHSNGLTEFGYLVTKTRLNDNTVVPNYSSLKYLNSRLPQGITFDNVLRGPKSLGQYLEDENYGALPSPINTHPGGSSYFSGGYDLKAYGSKYGGQIDGVQIEIHKNQRNEAEAYNYVEALGNAVHKFMQNNNYNN